MAVETVELNGRVVTLETGEVARQASGSVLLRDGETVLLAVVTAADRPTPLDYMPLTTEYRQKLAAAGRIPGGYERREGKANELEVLVSRLVDRSVRPFFADAWRYDTQLLLHPLSYDPASDLPILAILAAAAALNVSSVPWRVPLAAVRVGRHEGELVAFPSAEQRAAGGDGALDMVVSCSDAGIVMVEGGADELPEATILEAFALAQQAARPLQEALIRLREAAGAPARPVPEEARDEALEARVAAALEAPLRSALEVVEKQARAAAVSAAIGEALASLELADDAARKAAGAAAQALEKRLIREGVLAGRRLGGRAPHEVRAITGRVGWLPRAHGSSLFTRGETQAIVTATLGTDRDAQRLETIDGMVEHRFLLHYNFPPFSVGEVRPIRGPGRREIGHGHLARRALLATLPSREAWAYTVRLESTITESNGSSSMATVCGGTLALLDAGVPLRRPVAGIAMGLVQEGEQVVVLSDILGDEDHVGDMDFKVAGTSEGVTAIQLDNKLGALPFEVMERALAQARAGRLKILDVMAGVLAAPRPEPSRYAPRMATVRIQPNRIGSLIGPGGATIKGIRQDTGCELDVSDDGRVAIYGPSGEALAQAVARVEDLTGLPEVGREYAGRVVATKEFGAFVRLFEGVEGLLEGSTLPPGSPVRVRVTGVNDRGKLMIQRA